MTLIQKLGKDLSLEEMSLTSWYVGKEFANATNPYQKLSSEQFFKLQEQEKENIYFLVYTDKELVGFEVIYQLKEIYFMKNKYSILGTGSLIAIRKGIGIGSFLVSKVLEFLTSQEKSAIGFCEDSSLEFHKKINREIWLEAGKRIICKGEASTSHLIIYRGKDGFIEKLEKNPKENITCEYDFW